MELSEAGSELFSNREVLTILKNYAIKKQTNLATILYETTSYLESGPSSTYSPQQLADFLIDLKKYDLTRIEKVQLANLKPQNETELHLIIDNIEDKLTDEQRAELLKSIETFLGEDLEAKAKKKKDNDG